MTKGKKKGKKKGRKKAPATRKSAAAPRGLEAFEARVAALETHVAVSKEFVPGGPAGLATVVFDLDTTGNTAKFARLYFSQSPEHDIVNNLDKPHAELPGQKVGSTIQLMMEVRGDSGQKGSFTVKAATPTPLTLSVADGPKSPKLLFVSG